jgi:leucyl aminopeptidase
VLKKLKKGEKNMKNPNEKRKNEFSSFLGYPLVSWLQLAKRQDSKTKVPLRSGRIIFFGKPFSKSLISKVIQGEDVSAWALDWHLDQGSDSIELQGKAGPIWLIQGQKPKVDSPKKLSKPDISLYGRARDVVGSAIGRVFDLKLNEVELEVHQVKDEQSYGVVAGLEIGAYRFRRFHSKEDYAWPKLNISGISPSTIDKASQVGISVNLARHLVNLPANDLNPTSFAEGVKQLFHGSASSKVDIWQEAKLLKEGCGLLTAVGKGAAHPPCLVHIRYRPKQKSAFKRPIAFVGKGITFDTGGLDIKPSQFMRNMKKDMGGAGSVLALAWWLEQNQLNVPCDFWLALAENSIDAHSFRPGDILTARNGLKIEIHNTDAEGRLVLADAFDVAIGQKGGDEPWALVDLATLTGAVRVGLGLLYGGLFANDDALAKAVISSGHKSSDPVWQLPLCQDYTPNLKSTVADIANCSSSPYGGGITAALFLERFVGQTRWAHVDMMAWAEKSHGAIGEVGGNGQMVQNLIYFLENLKPDIV